MSGSLRKCCALLLAVLLAAAGFCACLTRVVLTVSASPDAGGRVPYAFYFEALHTTGGGGSIIQAFRDLELSLDQPIEATGWLATAEGVSAYQYMWLPVGGGSAEWITVEDAAIFERGDLASAGVEYISGHGTAGFTLRIMPPEDTPEGYYDVYIRALDGMGTPCDLATLLNLRYGEPDRVFPSGQTVSFPRIKREGESSLLGGATVEGDFLRIPPDGRVRLGNLNLAAFEEIRITYMLANTDDLSGERIFILGLKTAGEYSYGKNGEAYNTTDALIYAPLTERSGEVTLKLTDRNDSGEIWLTGHQSGDILISEIEFVANGYATDRVAARIRLSGELADTYFGSYNQTVAYGVTDPVLGEVLRLEVKEETGDPYAHFRAGDLLREHGIALDADEYKYMVLLYRADSTNNTDRMNLYLCSGSITGATEDCNQGVTLQNDGEWHYLLVDLTQKENWGGIINGWRFDYISGSSDPGDGVELAMVQFFRTAKAAYALAGKDPMEQEPYRTGDPAVIRDMCEEQDTQDGDFTLDPADTYEVTEPPAEPDSEPPTAPSETPAPDYEASAYPDETQPTPAKKGCASSTALMSLSVVPIALPCLLKKRKNCL